MSNAGSVTVVLSANTTSFSAAMTEAQRNLDKLSNKTKDASAHTVSGMQAASASIRLLENPLGNNIRAIERLISQSKVLSGVMKAAFPLVGAIAIGSMIAKLGTEVYAFIDKANKMPAAIKEGFESLHLSAMASNDALKLTDDLLQNHIDKLQGKPQNNLAIQLDEARIKADDLAKSAEEANKSVKALLTENKLSSLAGLLTGKAGTASVSGSVEFGLNEIQHLAYLNRQAVGTPGADQAQKNYTDKQAYYQKWATSQLFTRNHPEYATGDSNEGDMAGDQTANKNILTGFLDVLNDQQASQAEKNRNAKLVPAEKLAQEQSDAAKKAAEARKQAAEERLKSWEADAEVFKQWQAYSASTAKALADYQLDQFKTNGLSTDDNKSLTQAGKDSAARITAMRTQIDLDRQNSDALAESSIQMAVATGQMTKLDAARAMAALHQQQYAEAMQKLKDQGASLAVSPEYNGREEARQAALIDNQNRQNALRVSGVQQTAQDNQLTNPAVSSGATGFTNALDDFVNSTRDAATQMREITDSTLSTLNAEIVKGISGQRTSFGNAGASIFRNVAGVGIQKAEGSILGAFGFGGGGKQGTRSNPMYVRMADSLSGAASSVSSSIGGKMGGIFGSLLHMLPGFANGGSVSPGTLALVGERGPELAYFGSGAQITPNHQVANMMSSTADGGIHLHAGAIDARGAGDPAQVKAQVMQGIQQAAPHIVAASKRESQQHKIRTPSTKQ